MSHNKQTVQEYMEAFEADDHNRILSCLTEDVGWLIPGIFEISGKEAYRKEINNENFIGKPKIVVTRMVEENEIVVAEGTVDCQLKNGDWLQIFYCDVFRMRDGKISHLTSYLMNTPGTPQH